MKRIYILLGSMALATAAWGAVTVNVNGTSYSIPQTNEKGWGTSVTNWIQAISANTLQPNSGTFTLTSDLDFGSNYGLKSLYYKSRNASPAITGQIRLGNAEALSWRNSTNTADLPLTAGGGDRLQFNSVVIPTISSFDTLTNKTWNGNTIGVGYGGTGTTSSTGSGSVMLSVSPTSTGTFSAAQGYFSENVGIGTLSPEANLELYGANSGLGAKNYLVLSSNGVGSGDAQYIKFLAKDLERETGRIGLKYDNSTGPFGASFVVENLYAGATQSSTHFLVRNDGKVGIGNTSPTELLTVGGNVSAGTYSGAWGGSTITIDKGGTGATTASAALSALGGSPLAGSSSLTTTGTISSGTWNGGIIGIPYGGTGASSTTQSFVFAGPTSGAGAPSFRALVAADVPTLNQNTSGTASNVTGTVAVANGGTGATTAVAALSALGGSPLAGSASLTTTGTITSGTWNGSTIAIANGGTGATTASAALSALGGSPLAGSASLTTTGTITSGTWSGGVIAVSKGGTGTTTSTGSGAVMLALSPTSTGTFSADQGYFSGNVGVGTNAPGVQMHLHKASNGTGKISYQRFSTDGFSSGDGLYADYYSGASTSMGRVGLGYAPTTAYWSIENLYNAGTQTATHFKVSGDGSVTITNLSGSGSRAVNADANGVLSAASDSSLKIEQKNAKIPGLAEILKITPKAYKWKSDIQERGEKAPIEIGFFADQVAPIIPSAAPKGIDGLYGFYDRSVTAALVKAVQELKAENDAIKAEIKVMKTRK